MNVKNDITESSHASTVKARSTCSGQKTATGNLVPSRGKVRRVPYLGCHLEGATWSLVLGVDRRSYEMSRGVTGSTRLKVANE